MLIEEYKVRQNTESTEARQVKMKLFFALMFLTLMVSGREISSSAFHLFDMSFKKSLSFRVLCRLIT